MRDPRLPHLQVVEPPHRVRALVVGCGSYALLEDLDNPPHGTSPPMTTVLRSLSFYPRRSSPQATLMNVAIIRRICPSSDAAAVAALLEASGAEVLLLLNPTRDELEKGLRMLSDIQRKPFPEVRFNWFATPAIHCPCRGRSR